jgi:CDP-glucose 4,6-dehydratase
VNPTSAYSGVGVLVTGVHGFIGSWLAERLLEAGARVIAPDRPAKEGSRFERQRLAQRCEFVRMDLLDLGSVMRALDEHQVGAVFHLAAHTVVDDARRSPMSTFETNVRGTFNLLEACRLARSHAPERRVVIASSSYVYGNQGDIAYSEDVALRPSAPYDVSKACVDMLARCYATTHDMPVAVTRLANVYGAGDLNFRRLVPATARALVREERPVIRSDGTPERDYLYVEDAVSAYLAVESSLAKREQWGRAWNAGGGVPVSVAEVVGRLITASGADVEPEIQKGREDGAEVDRHRLDSGAIRRELGWAPRWGLEEGLASTWSWYRESV